MGESDNQLRASEDERMRGWHCVLFEEKTECEIIQLCVWIGGGWCVVE